MNGFADILLASIFVLKMKQKQAKHAFNLHCYNTFAIYGLSKMICCGYWAECTRERARRMLSADCLACWCWLLAHCVPQWRYRSYFNNRQIPNQHTEAAKLACRDFRMCGKIYMMQCIVVKLMYRSCQMITFYEIQADNFIDNLSNCFYSLIDLFITDNDEIIIIIIVIIMIMIIMIIIMIIIIIIILIVQFYFVISDKVS